jgi:outer membrane protein OmpA-like peptidoglycan-associated protein
MSNNFSRLGRNVAYALIVGSLALSLGTGFAGAGEQPSASTILKTLTPKSTTRGLSVSPADAAKQAKDKAFIDSLRNRKTRSLSTVELDKLTTITVNKPNIDLEINFEFNSDRISSAALPTVEALGKALSDPAMKGNTFVLAGHADATGKPDYNQDLSERRASAVKRYLVENYQIPAANLVTVGYGSTHLKNTKDPYAAENRRVAVVNMDDSTTAAK